MKELYKDLLFSKHILVCESSESDRFFGSAEDCFNVAMTLAGKFAIRVKKNVMSATIDMIKVAERNLGYYVPDPFYRNFPDSVRSMTPDALLYDQLLHYTHTYGLGWWENPGHSLLEKDVMERVVNEHSEPKDFDILSETEATKVLKDCLKDFLSSSRPLSRGTMDYIIEGWKDFHRDIIPEKIPCKETIVELLYTFKDPGFCRYLKLSDTIKLLNYIQYHQYNSENLKKLNLKNQDRKLITRVIDAFVELEKNNSSIYCDYVECFQKRKIWCGLFHHIHYKSDYPMMNRFICDVRNNKNYSAYHYFEEFLKKGSTGAAASMLVRQKGKSDLIRHLNYILSRCKSEKEIEEVFSWLE